MASLKPKGRQIMWNEKWKWMKSSLRLESVNKNKNRTRPVCFCSFLKSMFVSHSHSTCTHIWCPYSNKDISCWTYTNTCWANVIKFSNYDINWYSKWKKCIKFLSAVEFTCYDWYRFRVLKDKVAYWKNFLFSAYRKKNQFFSLLVRFVSCCWFLTQNFHFVKWQLSGAFVNYV